MRKNSKIGAFALALALTVALITPVTANADVIEEYHRDAAGDITSTTYRNEDTGASYELTSYVSSADMANAIKSKTTTIYIATNSKAEILGIMTTKDAAKFTNFKSNKKALKVKVILKNEFIDPSNPKGSAEPDFTDKDGNHYYRNVKGEVVKTDEAGLPKGGDYGKYGISLFTKKAGKYKLTYDAVLKDGTTYKNTLTIIAKDNGNAIKSITYGGKILAFSSDSSEEPVNGLWVKGFGHNATTKAKGVLKVNLDKAYKLKKIEIGTPKLVEKTEANGSKHWVYDKANTSLDICEDLQENDEAVCTWKTVKNGKKIKLSKVFDKQYGVYTSIKDHVISFSSPMSTTYIRVTYYDKKNKTTKRETFHIRYIKK